MGTVRRSFGPSCWAALASAAPAILGADPSRMPNATSPVIDRSMNMTRFTTTSRYGMMFSSPVSSSTCTRRRMGSSGPGGGSGLARVLERRLARAAAREQVLEAERVVLHVLDHRLRLRAEHEVRGDARHRDH